MDLEKKILGRREFFKESAKFLPFFIVPFLPQSTKSLLEEKYGIILYTLDEYLATNNSKLLYPAVNTPIREYDLETIDKALSILPPFFYAPQSTNRLNLVIEINPYFPGGGNGYCDCTRYFDQAETNEYQPAIHLNLNTNNQPRDIELIAHELTHYITPQSPLPKDIKPDRYPPKLATRWLWLTQIEAIFGQPFTATYQNLFNLSQNFYVQYYRKILEYSPPEAAIYLNRLDDIDKLSGINPQDLNDLYFFGDMKHATFFSHPNEFLAVMSQKYLFGEEYFISRFSQIVPQAVAEKLYLFTKHQIYRSEALSLPDLNDLFLVGVMVPSLMLIRKVLQDNSLNEI